MRLICKSMFREQCDETHDGTVRFLYRYLNTLSVILVARIWTLISSNSSILFNSQSAARQNFIKAPLKRHHGRQKCCMSGLSNHLWWIPAVPAVAVQSWQSVHVWLAECEVKNPGVVLYSVRIWRLGQHRDALLHRPAQKDLEGNKKN